MNFNMLRYLTLFLGLTTFISACGDSFSSEDPEVVDASLSDNLLRVSEGSILSLGLDFDRSSDSTFFNGDDEVNLIVRLPAGVRFREGTAEIQGIASDDDRVRPIVTNCTSGEQYLDFHLDVDDLIRGRNPSGDAESEITLTIDAVSVGSGLIEAAADDNDVLFGCGSIFSSDVREAVQVN